jgi:serine/threonine protein kinase/alpha-tubulin suppressor-like RCC1 family protein
MSRKSRSSNPSLAELEAEFDVVRELGQGGTAVVYLARDRELGRDVAIKVIRPSYAHDAEAVARLAREARLVARLRHPNLVTLFGTRRLGDGLALIMQYVPGHTLKALVRERGPLPGPLVEQVLCDMGRALKYAHGQHGIVHRDIKPENIYIDDEFGTALLADFGIARAENADSSLTMAGVAMGTPAYMSPEQIDGAELDGRSDLYSLGLVAYEMLTGRHPWAGENLYTLIYKQKNQDLPPIAECRPDAPPNVLCAVQGLLHKDRSKRWADADEFLRVLAMDEAALASLPVQAKRPKPQRKKTPRTKDSKQPTQHDDALTIRYRRAETAAPEVPVRPVPSQVGGEVGLGAEPPGTAPAVAAAGGLTGDPETVVPEGAGASPRPARSRRRTGILAGAALLVVASAVAVGLTLRGGGGVSAEWAGPAQQPAPAGAEGGEAGAARSDLAGRPARLVLLGPESTVGPPGEPLPGNVEVRVEDWEGKPVAGVPVAFQVILGGGEAVPAADTTNSSGVASAMWVLGPGAGDQLLDIRLDGQIEVAETVAALAVAREPSRIVVTGGQNQETVPGDPLPERVAVRVEDEVGNPVAGVPVEFAVAEGNGTVEPATAITTAAGMARATWTPGARPGEHRLVATVPGDPALEARVDAYVQHRLAVRPAVVTGIAYTCVVPADGRVHCWGGNESGQLGAGDLGRRAEPTPVAGDVRFAAIAAGGVHACALDLAGRPHCWGQNESGQLGDGSGAARPSPVPVRSAASYRSIAAGLTHTCAVSTDGRAYCWGANGSGQVGDGTRENRAAPVAVSGNHAFRVIVAGWNHSCGLTGAGAALCWGANGSGQLGDGTVTDRPGPVAVAGEHRFTELSAGAAHTCGVTGEGAIYCWGQNNRGQLGADPGGEGRRPVRVSGLGAATVVSAGAVHTCAVARDGAAWCWGANELGQLGNGSTTSGPVPTMVALDTRLLTLTTSGSHTCGRGADGETYCWGYNVEGQLGDGTRANGMRPIRVASQR